MDSSTKRLLYVEDNEYVRPSVERFLSANGYAVTSAESAETALRYAREITFDFYVFDGSFPIMEGQPPDRGAGIWLYDTLLKSHKPVRCVIVSSDNYEEECRLRGIKFLSKTKPDKPVIEWLLEYLEGE